MHAGVFKGTVDLQCTHRPICRKIQSKIASEMISNYLFRINNKINKKQAVMLVSVIINNREIWFIRYYVGHYISFNGNLMKIVIVMKWLLISKSRGGTSGK